MSEPIPIDAEIRNAIRANVETLCSECAFVLSSCENIVKRTVTIGGYTSVIECEGFQSADTEES